METLRKLGIDDFKEWLSTKLSHQPTLDLLEGNAIINIAHIKLIFFN